MLSNWVLSAISVMIIYSSGKKKKKEKKNTVECFSSDAYQYFWRVCTCQLLTEIPEKARFLLRIGIKGRKKITLFSMHYQVSDNREYKRKKKKLAGLAEMGSWYFVWLYSNKSETCNQGDDSSCYERSYNWGNKWVAVIRAE